MNIMYLNNEHISYAILTSLINLHMNIALLDLKHNGLNMHKILNSSHDRII